MQGTQAPCAKVKPGLFSVYNNRSRMDIRHPSAIGMVLGMAYIMAELGRFTAYITFHLFLLTA